MLEQLLPCQAILSKLEQVTTSNKVKISNTCVKSLKINGCETRKRKLSNICRYPPKTMVKKFT